jgi:putative nucleotidyltransferase with HDIG domain
MRIIEIYQKFKIPPNLQEHMLRVAKVGLFICHYWLGPALDKELITQACLLHDLGNLVRFDFENHSEFLGKEQSRLGYWQRVQKEMVKKYGFQADQATLQMIEEINLDPKVKNLIKIKNFDNIIRMPDSQNWGLKIVQYSDMRVGPFGVVSLKQRLDEAVKRLNVWRSAENLEALIAASFELEKQIQDHTNIRLTEITDRITKTGKKALLDVNI